MLKIISLVVYVIPLQIVLSKKTCPDYKRELADAQSAFVDCATHNSIPVNLCQKCAIEYYNMINSYKNVTKCAEFFDQDRLNVILTVQEAIAELWSKAFCNDCYVDNRNETFSKMYKAYDGCVINHNKTNICSNCTAVYKALNDYFVTLNKKNSGKVCFDFQDQMNRTRHYWSKTLNCCQREKHLTIFVSMAMIVTSIVGTFYLAAFGLTKYKERNYDILSDEGTTTANGITSTTSSTHAKGTSHAATDGVTTLGLNNSNNIAINDNPRMMN